MTPFSVKKKMTNQTIPVPCGKCPECKKRLVSGWSFRLMQEDKVSSSSHFITLTYATTHVPISRAGYMELSKRDVQLFFKRLRKVNRCKLKYFAVGEYGGKTMRPHYHIILFNADISTIQEAWQLGNCHYGTVNGASVGYTLKYMMKQPKIPMHRNDDRTPEFRLMSKGLGEAYMTKAMIRWHHAAINDRMYCNIEGGKKIAMPRFYKDKMYTKVERQVAGFHARINQLAREQRDLLLGRTMSSRDYAEAVKAAFNNMYKKADQGRHKI